MKWLRSIRTVFILAVLIPLLVAVLVFTAINNAGSQRAVEKVLEELQGTILEIVKNELNQKFSQAIVMNEKHLQSLERGLFTLDTPEGREPYFVTALENVPDAAMTFIGLRDGRFYGARRMTTGEIQVARNNASTGGASEYYQVNEKGIGTSFVQKFANFDPRTRPWYQNAANREEAVFSDIYSHFVFREPTITASLPIYQDGELAGVFGVDFLMTWLGETLRQLPIGPNGLVFIVDQKGDLVASSSGEAIFRVSETGAKTIPMEEAENLIIRTASLIYTDGNPDTLSRLIIGGKEYLLIKEDYRLLGLEWDVYVALASEDFLAGMLETRASVNRNMGFFILGFLIFAFWFSGWLTSPIIALSASARKLKGGVYEPVPFMDRQDELGQLTSSYNEMAEQLTSLVSHLESQVQERTRDLQKALDEKSEFLATMSHEIRSPMNVVMGMADLVMDSELQPVQREYVQLIKDAAKRLLQVINEVLDFSKIEAGKLKLNPAPFSFKKTVEKLVTMYRVIAGTKKVDLLLDYDSSMPEWLEGDAGRLEQVLINLIDNAIKFTEKGQVKVSIRKTGGEDGSVSFEVAVSDTGIGIPEDKVGMLFRSFTQVDGGRARSREGTGLGLAISQNLISLMGGEIQVESQPGEGSKFFFHLSLPMVNDSVEQKESESLLSLEDSLRTIAGSRILLAEDQEVNQLLAKLILEKMGCHVSMAENGLRALEIMKKETFDLVLMDIQMPEMDGLEATRKIREGAVDYPYWGEVPIIALTANAMAGDRESYLREGMNDYISKPFNRQEMVHTLAKNLISRR